MRDYKPKKEEILKSVGKLPPNERLGWVVNEILDIKDKIESLTKPPSERVPTDSARAFFEVNQ